MNESQSQRYTVVNLRDQPVELYVGAESITLPAYGEIEIERGDLAGPQMERLLSRQLIDVRPVAVAAASAATASDTAAAAAEHDESGPEALEESAPEAAAAEEPAAKTQTTRKTRRKT